MTHFSHHDYLEGPKRGDADWPSRRASLVRGLKLHVQVFLLAAPLLLMINWITLGDDGGWWSVLILQIWAAAAGLHVLGVSTEFARNRSAH
ncbi:MAG: hypothetical protein HKN07_15820 [Acidimicrobiia bacterium]|nr:hypothetical protein [Acidimicrobiia bacterium]